MAQLTKSDLEKLSQRSTGPAVSIYMPTQMAGPDTRENPIRFKNRVKEAEEQLLAQGHKAAEVDALLAPAKQLIGDHQFWQHQQHGLAMFCAPEAAYRYRLPMRLGELTVVAERFHLKQLLPLFANDGHFYILVASLNHIRMLEGTRHEVSEVALEDMPTSLAEFLRFDDFERSLQHHVTLGQGRGAGLGQGRGDAMYHGHGAGGDDDRKKTDILRFFQQIDNGVRELFADSRPPLVFAGVEYLFGIYKEANKYPGLVDQAVTGNFDEVREEEVHQQAWQLVEPQFAREEQKAKDAFRELGGTGRTTADLQEAIEAALDGRIDTVFVAADEHRWGVVAEDERRIELHDEERADNEDLLDFVAVKTLLSGGTVYTVNKQEVPNEEPLAAVLRY